MKDLKHMIFFEELLRQSHNTLVQQAVDEGQLALGYNCYYNPGGAAEPEGLLFLAAAGARQRYGGGGVVLHDQPELPLCALHFGARHRGRL